MSDHEREQQFVEEFQSKFRKYHVATDATPVFHWHTVRRLPRAGSIWSDESLTLRLNLGERIGEVQAGLYRTGSRYELSDKSGAVLSTVESVFAVEDLDTLDYTVRIAKDEESNHLLLIEDHSWSVQRIILFNLSSPSQTPQYLRVPSRASFAPVPHYEIIGFREGRLFLQQDGTVFALPVEILETTQDPVYGIG